MTTITVSQAAAQVVAQYDRNTHTGMALAIEALRAALAQQADPSGWRPIETAPIGKWVYTWREGEKGTSVAMRLEDDEWLGPHGHTTVTSHAYLPPTHWQPLPEPPKEISNG